MKVVIVVSGGNVQSVYSDDENCSVDLIDYDNAEAEGEVEEAEDEEADAEENLYHVY